MFVAAPVLVVIIILVCTLAFLRPKHTIQQYQSFVVDNVILAFALITLVLVCCRSQDAKQSNPEWLEYFVDVPPVKQVAPAPVKPGAPAEDRSAVVDDNSVSANENVKPISVGLTTYVSCFSKESYAGSGKIWYNLGSSAATCKDNDGFYFNVTPSFSRRSGFVMGPATSIAGPNSYALGINADMAFTVFVMFQPTQPIPTQGKVCAFKMFANTVNNNAISLWMENGSTVGSLYKCDMYLQVGNGERMPCKMQNDDAVLLTAQKKHLLIIVKNYSGVKVCIVNMDDSVFSNVVVLNTQLSGESTADLDFSNKDMIINPTSNWPTNLQTFGIYNRAFTETDITTLYSHYRELLKLYDPFYVDLMNQLKNNDDTKKCPYDAATCAKCGTVTDWSNFATVMAADKSCTSAVNAFCVNNIHHEKCACWDASNPQYNTSCTSIRGFFDASSSNNSAGANCKIGPSINDKFDWTPVINTMLSDKNVDVLRQLLNQKAPVASAPMPDDLCDESSDSDSDSECECETKPAPPPPVKEDIFKNRELTLEITKKQKPSTTCDVSSSFDWMFIKT